MKEYERLNGSSTPPKPAHLNGLPIFPEPALDGPVLQRGEADHFAAYWQARQLVLLFRAFPTYAARGVVDELQRQGIGLLRGLVSFENAVYGACRAERQRRKRKQLTEAIP